MFYNDMLTEKNVQAEIDNLQARIIKLQSLKNTIATLTLYEVGIRKSDHRVAHMEYTFYNGEGKVRATFPGHQTESVTMSLDAFQLDYVVFSSKTRALFPKRSV